MNVREKVMIVTGASEGIGLQTARLLSGAGARLALAARSAEKLRTLAAELGRPGADALAIPVDLRREDEARRMVEETFARFGRIDVLINNAGQGMAGFTETSSVEDYLRLIELNLFGPVWAMQAVIPKMRSAGGGLILNVSSMVSKMHIPGLGFYASTKSALNVLSETARTELAKDNIRVITVFPRATATNFGINSRGDRALRQRQRTAPHAGMIVDSAEHVARRIVRAIEVEPAEQYMDENESSR
jgi:short-subunit dehydrogenase